MLATVPGTGNPFGAPSLRRLVASRNAPSSRPPKDHATPMPLWTRLLLSALLVATVFWCMWRVPPRVTALTPWAPWLALISPWLGVAALGCAVAVWPAGHADPLVAITLMVLSPGAIASGAGVLWVHRGVPTSDGAIAAQRLQARVGIGLGLLAALLVYVFVFLSRRPDVI